MVFILKIVVPFIAKIDNNAGYGFGHCLHSILGFRSPIQHFCHFWFPKTILAVTKTLNSRLQNISLQPIMVTVIYSVSLPST